VAEQMIAAIALIAVILLFARTQTAAAAAASPREPEFVPLNPQAPPESLITERPAPWQTNVSVASGGLRTGGGIIVTMIPGVMPTADSGSSTTSSIGGATTSTSSPSITPSGGGGGVTPSGSLLFL